jgi:toxin ParE1/3/4
LKSYWSAQASRDADAIWDWIAADDPDAADRIIARFHAAVSTLEEQPRLGRPAHRRGVREFIIGGTPYIVVYRVRASAVEIQRIRHAKQQWPQGP